MKPYISVIVPCYNATSFLERCFEGFLNQTIGFEHLQVIFVDDCSTDDTWEQLIVFEKKYPEQVTIVHNEENIRQGGAREVGLQYALADYVAFMDVDDELSCSIYEKMYEAIRKHQCDVVKCGHVRKLAGQECNTAQENGTEQVIRINSAEDRRKMILEETLGHAVWDKLFDLKYWRENEIHFPWNIAYEDIPVGIQLHMTVQSVCILEDVLYYYIVNPDSTILSKDKTYHYDILKANDYKWQIIINNELYRQYEKELKFDYIVTGFYECMKVLLLRFSKVPYDMYVALREIVRERVPDYRDIPYARDNVPEVYGMLLTLLDKQATKEELEKVQEAFRNIMGEPEKELKRGYSVVVISDNTFSLLPECILHIKNTIPGTCEIIVVDNCSTDGSKEWLESQNNITCILNTDKKGYAAVVNQGIKCANTENDIVLIDGDVVVYENGIQQLRKALYSQSDCGIVISASNSLEDLQEEDTYQSLLMRCEQIAHMQNYEQEPYYEQRYYDTTTAVMIKRELIDRIGMMDMQYCSEQYCCRDLGVRAVSEGYRSIVCHNSLVCKGYCMPVADSMVERDAKLFCDKWGFDMSCYANARMELIDMMDCDSEKPIHVLEVGCGLGATLAKIQFLYPNSSVKGLEIVTKVADIGSHLLEIEQGDIEKKIYSDEKPFDYIIMGDVIEHLREPEKVIKKLCNCLAPEGKILCSIPNIMHYSALIPLLGGNFEYMDSGILDRTHLRFFTLNSILHMMEECGLELYHIGDTRCNTGNATLDQRINDYLTQLTQLEFVADIEQFYAFQYLICAGKKEVENKKDTKQQEQAGMYADLGNQLLGNNDDQAYLCYEQAAFLCKEEQEKKKYYTKMQKLLETSSISVKPTSIVIVSYNEKEMMQSCIESVRAYCAPGSYEIVVVDNASQDGVCDWLKEQQDVKLVASNENYGFPKGCNIGIAKSEKQNDIFLLNNDTVMTPGALFWLRMGLYSDSGVGAVGAVSNCCGNEQQIGMSVKGLEEFFAYAEHNQVPLESVLEERAKLCGFAMLMKREALEKTDYLDEMFSPGYFEDDDISLQIRRAGYRLFVSHNSFIYHAGSQSFKKRTDGNEIYEKNYLYLKQKWGFDACIQAEAYTAQDALLSDMSGDKFSMLIVNAGCGSTVGHVKYLCPLAEVDCVETDSVAVSYAMKMQGCYYNSLQTVNRRYDFVLVCWPALLTEDEWKIVETLGECVIY